MHYVDGPETKIPGIPQKCGGFEVVNPIRFFLPLLSASNLLIWVDEKGLFLRPHILIAMQATMGSINHIYSQVLLGPKASRMVLCKVC